MARKYNRITDNTVIEKYRYHDKSHYGLCADRGLSKFHRVYVHVRVCADAVNCSFLKLMHI